MYTVKKYIIIYKISWNRKIIRKFYRWNRFTLGGTEDEAYLRQVAAYLNEKIGEVRKMDGFSDRVRNIRI